MNKASQFVLLALATPPCFAGYVVTGQIEASVCHGFVIEVCSLKNIHAVKGKDGRLYTITNRFESVSDYRPEKKRCWISTKSRDLSVISWGINAAITPEFYERNSSGEYQVVDAEYLTFPCRKE